MLYLALLFYFLSFFSGLFHSNRLWASLLMGLALSFYLAHLAVAHITQKTFPLGDLHGFVSLLGNLFVLTFLFVSYKYKALLYFNYLVAFLGLLATLFTLPSSVSPYKSTLYSLHFISASLSYLFAFIGGMSSSLKLFIEKRLKNHSLFQAYVPLNSLRTAEKLFTSLAFLGFTITLIFGSLWTRTQFGRHWIDDPKLLITLFLWLYFALLSHLNLLKKLKPRRFSEGVIVGALLSLMSLIFIRHSF